MKLTVAIPTYNRAEKLGRTVSRIAAEVIHGSQVDNVEILVSDNASPDNTAEVITRLANEFPQVKIRYQRHPQNLGISGNLLSLYRNASNDYVWFFSDDDVPFPGCLARITEVLNQHQPSVLLFSFTQPPDSPQRLFDFPEPVHIVRDANEAVELVRRDGKLSSHVYRRVELPDETVRRTNSVMQACPLYGFWTMAFDVLEACAGAPMAVVSEPLAGCQEDFVECLNWHPLEWKVEAQIFAHPYVKHGAPTIYQEREKWMYNLAGIYYWMWCTGTLGISDRMAPEWWEALKRFPIKWRWVLTNPRVLVRLLALKIAPRSLPGLIARRNRSS